MVAILLSTYNGGKYLGEQIESLLAQTYADWKLYIRDDGSKDDTLRIIENYVKRYPDKIFLNTSLPHNVGAGESFMHLLKEAEAEYYMFCDQDDVWMPHKVEFTLRKAKDLEQKYGVDAPIGIFTDLEVVDEELNVLMPSLWRGDNRHPEYIRDFYKQWTNRHAMYGCTLLINRAAKGIVLPYRQFENTQGAHDTWIEYFLIRKGILDYIDEPTIHYRQHTSNVVGANMNITYFSLLKDIIRHPSHFFKKITKDYRRTRLFPFPISYPKIVAYRFRQTLESLFK